MYCLCVNVYSCHQVSTQLQLNIYHIILYHIIWQVCFLGVTTLCGCILNSPVAGFSVLILEVS